MPRHLLIAGLFASLPALGSAQTLVPRPQLFQPSWIEDFRRADFDGDGFDEVFAKEVAFTPNPVYVWEPDPTGRWGTTRAEGVGFFPTPALADFDGDGFMDFALLEDALFSGAIAIYYGGPEGQGFTRALATNLTARQGSKVAAPDFDGDGDPDLVIGGNNQFVLLRHDGARQFTLLYSLSETLWSRSITAVDVDDDGFEDLVYDRTGSSGNGSLTWRRSRGDGRFEPAETLVSGTGLSWELDAVDVDGDGDRDVYCTMASAFGVGGGDRTSYWVQLGPGGTVALRNDHLSFPGAPERIGDIRDLDLDGIPDVLLVTDDRVTYRRGLGGGAFDTPVDFPNPPIPGFDERAAVIVDVDGDGDEDILRGWATWLENTTELGTLVCAGAPNAAGPGARLFAAGSDLIGVDRLTLNAEGLPGDAFGLFFTSLQSSTPTPVSGSVGFLCLGGSIGRFNRPGEIDQANAAGVLRLGLELVDVPDAALGSVAIVAPETRYFQLWYRDTTPAGATSNFSGAIGVDLR